MVFVNAALPARSMIVRNIPEGARAGRGPDGFRRAATRSRRR